MELMIEALRILREEYHFNGYIHAKTIPGADPMLVEKIGGWRTACRSISSCPARRA